MKTLIVDDDPVMREIIAAVVTERGYQPVPCASAEIAWDMHHAEAVPLVILDVVLPGIDGLELCRRLRGEALWDNSVIIVITARTSPDDLQAVLDAGADDYLPKPLDINLLNIRLAIAERKIKLLTDRTAAVSEMRRHQQLAERIINSSLDGIVGFDCDLKVAMWNNAMEQIFGIPATAALGRNYLDVFPFLRAIGEDEFIDEALSGSHVCSQNRQFQIPETDRQGFFESYYSPIHDAEDVIVGGLAVVRDITNGKRLEEQLWRSQKMEAVGRLAGGIAHDFNNLLAVVLGYSELSLKRSDEDPTLKRHLEEIRNAGNRGASLTRQLLAFGRRQVVKPQVLQLNDVLSSMEEMLRPLIGVDIDLAIVPSPVLAYIKADAAQIEQVVMNLVVNARDAMSNSGKLTVETDNVELTGSEPDLLIGAAPGGYVAISVTDTGTGMDTDTLEHMFEPFYSTKDVGKGTGLGLATVYGIVKECGGDMRVCTQSGKGTTFHVYLPRHDDVSLPEETVPQASALGGDETILIVDDEAGIREIIKHYLKSHGYNVLEARHAGEAVEICWKYKWDIQLLLTDIVMPMVNGRDLARRLLGIRPELRVMFMSGYPGDRAVCQATVNENFLTKPFTEDALMRRIRSVLDQPAAAETC